MKIFGIMIMAMNLVGTLRPFYHPLHVKRNFEMNDMHTRDTVKELTSSAVHKQRYLNEDDFAGQAGSDLIESDLDTESAKESVDDFSPEDIYAADTSSNFDYNNEENPNLLSTALPSDDTINSKASFEDQLPDIEESEREEPAEREDENQSVIEDSAAKKLYEPLLNIAALDQRISILKGIKENALNANIPAGFIEFEDINLIDDLIFFMDEVAFIEEELADALTNEVRARKLITRKLTTMKTPIAHPHGGLKRNLRRHSPIETVHQVLDILPFEKHRYLNKLNRKLFNRLSDKNEWRSPRITKRSKPQYESRERMNKQAELKSDNHANYRKSKVLLQKNSKPAHHHRQPVYANSLVQFSSLRTPSNKSKMLIQNPNKALSKRRIVHQYLNQSTLTPNKQKRIFRTLKARDVFEKRQHGLKSIRKNFDLNPNQRTSKPSSLHALKGQF